MTASMLNANAPRHFGLTEADDSWGPTGPLATDAEAVLDALIAEAEADAQQARHVPRIRWPYEPAPSRQFSAPARRVDVDVPYSESRFVRESRYAQPLPPSPKRKPDGFDRAVPWMVALIVVCAVGMLKGWI